MILMAVVRKVYKIRALSNNPVIYHRGERRGRRVLRLIRSSAFSACSAVKFKDIVILLNNSIMPKIHIYKGWYR